MTGRTHVKIVKVGSNDGAPLVYLPKEIARYMGVAKGDKVMFSIIDKTREVIIEKIGRVIEGQDKGDGDEF